jgi:hypothetical protein
MYGPMALAATRRVRPLVWPVIGVGLAFLAASLTLARSQAILAELVLILAGLGWSLTQIGVSPLIHDSGDRSRLGYAIHDSVVLGAALLGAFSAAS